jgi:hypothetical protein
VGWVWGDGFKEWLKTHYFWCRLYFDAKQVWGIPQLASVLLGLLFPPAQAKASNQLRWLFHYWFLAGIIFYAFGAQELVINLWNLTILYPALGPAWLHRDYSLQGPRLGAWVYLQSARQQ